MFTTMSVQRLSTGTVYKLWFIGLSVSLVPLCILFGVLALFGFNTVTWNGQHLHGVSGFIVSLFIGVFIALMGTAFFGSAAAFGLWLYSKFRSLTLSTKNVA